MRICHPASWRGSGYFLFQTQSSAANAAPLWAMVIPPLRAQNSATLTLRKLIDKFQFVDSFRVLRSPHLVFLFAGRLVSLFDFMGWQ